MKLTPHLSLLIGLLFFFRNVHSFESKLVSSRSSSSSSLFSTVSWPELEEQVRVPDTTPPPVYIDSLRDTSTPRWSQERPTLIREREGWCPYSERVWLALEHLNVPYDTVRIDNSGYGPRPSYYSGQTPQVRWPGESRAQGESMDLVNRIYKVYGDVKDLAASSENEVYVEEWRNIMPKRSRPSSRAAFLFQFNGEPLWRSVLEDSLNGVNTLLSQQPSGPFFTGDTLGPADVCWAPFLERYRYQLPCLHEGLEPNDPDRYPNLARWYKAMDSSTTVPSYSCRVKGNAASWRKVLCMAGFGNAGVPPTVQTNMDSLVEKENREARDLVSTSGDMLWKAYAASRGYVCSTPQQEAARILLENREAIHSDTMKHSSEWKDDAVLEVAMKDLVLALSAQDSATELSCRLARFLTERMCVPRDMGCLPAAHIHVHGLPME